MKVQVKKRVSSRLKKGYSLIQKEDLAYPQRETTQWVELVDPQNQFIVKGYLGKQNKRIGRVLNQQDIPFDHSFSEEFFVKLKEKRTSFFSDDSTTAFRIFNGEGDGIGGLITDYYAGYTVFLWYNETLYTHRELLIQAFREIYPEIIGGYEEIRSEPVNLPESQFTYGKEAPEPLIVKENGIKFAVYLNEGLMAGISLDQKEVRGSLAGGFASRETVLNVLSHTGTFSVAAAMEGAIETTSVDLAECSLKKTQEQFEVNGLDVDQQKIIVMDVFQHFRYTKRKQFLYDMIVLDPPSFARNKKKVSRMAKDYGELVKDSPDILVENGILIASTDAANVSIEQFQTMTEEEFHAKNVSFEQLASYRLPKDSQTTDTFLKGSYLKVFVYQIKNNH